MTLMNSHREESLLKLESFFTDLIQSIELGQEPDIHLASWGNRGRGSNRRVRFLSPKYLRMVWTMASMYENILEDKSVNQRQLYYSNKRASVDDKLSQPDAFNSSAQAASTVLECCALLGLSRCDLQVASTARGLVAGHLFIGNLSGQPSTEWRSLADLDAPTRIEPTFLTARSRASSASDWLQVPTHAGRPIPVVLFEKDAIFQDFYRSGIWRRDYPCVMVTGCGVPDIPTRALVSALDALGCPIVAFVDYNPSGLLILSTYAVGSSTTGARHVAGRVGAGESSLLEVPRILLGGVTAADILFVDRHHCQPFGARDESVLRTLQRRCLDGTLIGMAALGDMRREVDAMAAAPRKVELGTEVRHRHTDRVGRTLCCSPTPRPRQCTPACSTEGTRATFGHVSIRRAVAP